MPISASRLATIRAKSDYVICLYFIRLAFIPWAVLVREGIIAQRRAPMSRTSVVALLVAAVLVFFAIVYGHAASIPVTVRKGFAHRSYDIDDPVMQWAMFADLFTLWRPRPLPEGHDPDPLPEPADPARPLRKHLHRRR